MVLFVTVVKDAEVAVHCDETCMGRIKWGRIDNRVAVTNDTEIVVACEPFQILLGWFALYAVGRVRGSEGEGIIRNSNYQPCRYKSECISVAGD